MATHSNTLAWKVTQTEEPGWLQSLGLQEARHDLAAKQQHLFDTWDRHRKLSESSKEPELSP